MKIKSEGGSNNNSSSSGGGSGTSAGNGKSLAVFSELLSYYEERLTALQQVRDTLESSGIALTPPATPPSDRGTHAASKNRALLAMELFTEMVDDMAMNVVFEAHAESKQGISVCSICHTRCQLHEAQFGAGQGGSSDAAHESGASSASGGSSGTAAGPSEMFECPNCGRSFPVPRFAAHMDKCMGLSSRRTATRRSAANSTASTPSYLMASYDSSSEQGADRKRKTSGSVVKDLARKKSRRK